MDIFFFWNKQAPSNQNSHFFSLPLEPNSIGCGRKAWLLVTIFAIHSPLLLPSFFRREEKGGTKVMVKSHAFLLDLPFGARKLQLMKERKELACLYSNKRATFLFTISNLKNYYFLCLMCLIILLIIIIEVLFNFYGQAARW